MLTFELADEGHRIEIHGNKEGLLKLAKYIIDLAEKNESGHVHLMTESWGGNELDNDKQGLENELINHAKIFAWE